MELLAQTYFGDILHDVTQVLIIPVIIALLLLILYALWCVGRIVAEWLTSHRHFTVIIPRFLKAIVDASEEELPDVIMQSGLLGNQKRMLLTLWDYRCLPVDAHVALAKRLVDELDDQQARVISRTSTVSKIAPMLGLMGTLIPLGPGIVSLGYGDTNSLSASMLVAFDTTVAGLLVALATYVITKIRTRWYENYMTAFEAAITAILEKVDTQREKGAYEGMQPSQFAQMYLPMNAKEKKKAARTQECLAKKEQQDEKSAASIRAKFASSPNKQNEQGVEGLHSEGFINEDSRQLKQGEEDGQVF